MTVFLPCLVRGYEGNELRAITLGDPSLDDFLVFVAVRARTNTWLAVASDLKIFFTVVAKPPAEVTTADVFGFLASQRAPRQGVKVVRIEDGEPGLAARTIARRLSSVRGLFAYLAARGDAGVARNPVPASLAARRAGARRGRGGVPLVRTPRTLPRILSPGEVDALVGALRTRRDRAMVEAMVLGGLRRCEVLGLRLEDVNAGERRVFVAEGKGGRQRVVVAAVTGGDLRRLPSRPLEQVRLRCPIVPRNVFGTGTNYLDHLAGMGASAPAAPTANFMKLQGSVAGPGDPVVAPAGGFLDYEAEIAVLIGRATGPGDDIDGVIAGLLLANDFTARDAPTTHLTLAKSGPGYCPLGPAVVTLDEVDPQDVSFELRVNGEVRQRAHTSTMVHSIEAVVASYARALPLHPGDVVLTGSPGGVGVSLDPPRRLEPGDLVVVSSPRLGELATPIIG